MVLWKEFLLSQISVNGGESPLIRKRSLSGLDMGDQLRRIFITGLSKMHFIPHPECGPFLPISGIEIIGRVDQLGRR